MRSVSRKENTGIVYFIYYQEQQQKNKHMIKNESFGGQIRFDGYLNLHAIF